MARRKVRPPKDWGRDFDIGDGDGGSSVADSEKPTKSGDDPIGGPSNVH